MSDKNSEMPLSTITSEVLDATKGGSVEVGGYKEIQDLLRHLVLVPFINQGCQGDSIEPIPKGVILHGEQGTGKTLLAKHLAWSISKASNTPVTFYKMYGTEQFSSNIMDGNFRNLIGIRNLFESAIKTQPSVIFIDKIDTLCPDRNMSIQNATFYASVISTISGQFAKIEAGKVLVVASTATNKLESIDPSIRQSGRFDKIIEVRLPNENDRLEILKIHSKKMFYDGNDGILAQVSQGTQDFSGEDLKSLCHRVIANARKKLKTPKEMGMEENAAYFEMISNADLTITEEDWNMAFRQIYEDKKTY